MLGTLAKGAKLAVRVCDGSSSWFGEVKMDNAVLTVIYTKCMGSKVHELQELLMDRKNIDIGVDTNGCATIFVVGKIRLEQDFPSKWV